MAVPAHPALTAFVHPCTADVESDHVRFMFLTEPAFQTSLWVRGLYGIFWKTDPIAVTISNVLKSYDSISNSCQTERLRNQLFAE
ncbi:MAG TPA: hypothetical protein DDW45_07220 [Gammaproteobacteria bacterium]|nr:hypothetical protein [Gammaproteobacteria bacterium]